MGWRLERIGVARMLEAGFEEMRRWQRVVDWVEVEVGFEEMRRWQQVVVVENWRNENGCRPEWIVVGALNRDVSGPTVRTSRYLP